jgi:hypothetical protein
MLVPLAGILLILLAVWLTGGAQPVVLDEALVARRIAEDLGGATADDVTLAADRSAALATLAAGASVAVAFRAGDKIAVRRLAPGEVRRVAVEPRGGMALIAIDTGDFARRRVELRLPATEAARWETRIAALVPGAVAA